MLRQRHTFWLDQGFVSVKPFENSRSRNGTSLTTDAFILQLPAPHLLA
jgi:hypothetical protein